MREGFTGLVSHAIDRLKVPAGSQPKIFQSDALVENFVAFFDTFRAKNLMDDEALENVVGEAQAIVLQFAPFAKRSKTDISLRNEVAAKLESVKGTLDGLLKDRPIRKFGFED